LVVLAANIGVRLTLRARPLNEIANMPTLVQGLKGIVNNG
jgi:hypothetical protein